MNEGVKFFIFFFALSCDIASSILFVWGTESVEDESVSILVLSSAFFRAVILPLTLLLGYFQSRIRNSLRRRKQSSPPSAGSIKYSLLDISADEAAAEIEAEGDSSKWSLGRDLRFLKTKKQCEKWSKLTSVVIFLLLFIAQLLVGWIAIFLPDDASVLSISLLFSTIVWLNGILFISRSILTVQLKEGEGAHSVLSVHHHPLSLVDSAFCHWCHVCHKHPTPLTGSVDEEISKDNVRAFVCTAGCDFMVCLPCFKDHVRRAERRDALEEEAAEFNKNAQGSTNLALYLRTALPFLRVHWPFFLFGGILLLLQQGASLIIPTYQGAIINDIVSTSRELFMADVFRFLASVACVFAFGTFSTGLLQVGGRLVQTTVKKTLYAHIITQDIPFFDAGNAGDLVARIHSDAVRLIQPLQQLSSSTISTVLRLIGAIIMCLLTSWRLSLLSFVTIGPIFLVFKEYGRFAHKFTRIVYGAIGYASAHATESFRNIKSVKAFSLEAQCDRRHTSMLMVSQRAGIKDALFAAGVFSFTTLIDRSIGILVLVFAGNFILAHPNSAELNVGKLVSFQIYWGILRESFNGLAGGMTQLTRAAGSSQRVVEILTKSPKIESKQLHKPVPPIPRSPPSIRFENVTFRYPLRPGNTVLRSISFNVEPGTRTALVGSSGCGKSTVIRLLQRFYDPESGRIFFDGKPMTDYVPTDMRRMIGVVSQNSEVFNVTIRENIRFGVGDSREIVSEEEVERAAKLAHAHEFIERFEDGYDTIVGEAGSRVSGGQRQRLAIARVLIRQPPCLLLDEATSSLDAESEHQVQMGLDQLLTNSKSTQILSSHRFSSIKDSDQILVFDKGEIVERGTHDELMAKNAHYAHLFHRQMTTDK